MLDANFNASSRSNSPPNRSDPNEPGAIRAFFCISFISATFRGPPFARRLKPTEPLRAAAWAPRFEISPPGNRPPKCQNMSQRSDPIRDPRSAAAPGAARVPRPIEAKPRARNLPPSAAIRAPRRAGWGTCKGAGSPQTITVKIKQLSLIKKSAILRP